MRSMSTSLLDESSLVEVKVDEDSGFNTGNLKGVVAAHNQPQDSC